MRERYGADDARGLSPLSLGCLRKTRGEFEVEGKGFRVLWIRGDMAEDKSKLGINYLQGLVCKAYLDNQSKLSLYLKIHCLPNCYSLSTADFIAGFQQESKRERSASRRD